MRSGGKGTVPTIIVSELIYPVKGKGITLKDPRLFIMFA